MTLKESSFTLKHPLSYTVYILSVVLYYLIFFLTENTNFNQEIFILIENSYVIVLHLKYKKRKCYHKQRLTTESAQRL